MSPANAVVGYVQPNGSISPSTVNRRAGEERNTTMEKGQESPEFGFSTLESATVAARDRASAEHHRHFVVTNAAAFDVVPVEMLEGLIHRDARGAGMQLAILRVASPDGAVEAVDDPGDSEGRLVAFCTSG